MTVSLVPHSTSPFAQISYTDADGVLPAGSPPLRLPNMLAVEGVAVAVRAAVSIPGGLPPAALPVRSSAQAWPRRQHRAASASCPGSSCPCSWLSGAAALNARLGPTSANDLLRKSTKLIRKKHQTAWARFHVDRPPHMEYTVAAAWNAVYDAMRYDTTQEMRRFVILCSRPL